MMRFSLTQPPKTEVATDIPLDDTDPVSEQQIFEASRMLSIYLAMASHVEKCKHALDDTVGVTCFKSKTLEQDAALLKAAKDAGFKINMAEMLSSLYTNADTIAQYFENINFDRIKVTYMMSYKFIDKLAAAYLAPDADVKQILVTNNEILTCMYKNIIAGLPNSQDEAANATQINESKEDEVDLEFDVDNPYLIAMFTEFLKRILALKQKPFVFPSFDFMTV